MSLETDQPIEIILEPQEYLEETDTALHSYETRVMNRALHSSIVFMDDKQAQDEVLESVKSLKRVYQQQQDVDLDDPVSMKRATPNEEDTPPTSLVHAPFILEDVKPVVDFGACQLRPAQMKFQVINSDGIVLKNVFCDDNKTIRYSPKTMGGTDGNSNFPAWSLLLNDHEKIGESIRGWLLTERDMMLLLTQHRMCTNSVWGTRQSPNSGKVSTRLMWKSQYVAFDGIPFINAGSRAVVMECKYGPRRKGVRIGFRNTQYTKLAPSNCDSFQATCPARIYVKKVIKFVNFRVDIIGDKKLMKIQMDKMFRALKCELDNGQKEIMNGESRYYVQLPMENAHEFHDRDINGLFIEEDIVMPPTSSGISSPLDTPASIAAAAEISSIIEAEYFAQAASVTAETATACYSSAPVPAPSPTPIQEPRRIVSRIDMPETDHLDSRVQAKIMEFVALGESNTNAIRKKLRKFVDEELIILPRPKKHDQDFYPTVNDLHNRIHLALRDLQNGSILSVETIGDLQSSAYDDDLQTNEIFENVVNINLTLKKKNDDNAPSIHNKMLRKIDLVYVDGSTHSITSINTQVISRLNKLMPGLLPPDICLPYTDQIQEDPQLQSASVEENSIKDSNLYSCDMSYDKNQYIYTNGEDDTLDYNSLYTNIEVFRDAEEAAANNSSLNFNIDEVFTVSNEDYEFIS